MKQFEISFDEQKFKNQYFNHKKSYINYIFGNWSYYLITNSETLKQYFCIYSLEYYGGEPHNNFIFYLSNKFGNSIFNKTNYFPNRYLIHLGSNYYLTYYYLKGLSDDIGFAIHNIVCIIIYLDNFVLRYDEDYFDWRALTPKKILGHIPINLPLSIISKKFEIMKNVINAQILLHKK